MERLQKILANAGVDSRRKCEELIKSGKVTVNGKVVTELGAKADPAVDAIAVGGKPIAAEAKLYLMFNKPKGVITSLSDPQGRSVVADYMKEIKERLYPVGRLDYDSEGLLLLTNDGDLAHKLTHPSRHVPKTYHATVERVPHGNALDKLRAGIRLEDGMTAPAEVEYHDIDPAGKFATIVITIHEGRNRQVRRMFDAIHHPVTRLKRVSFGGLFLGGLQRGKHRKLKEDEIAALRTAAAEEPQEPPTPREPKTLREPKTPWEPKTPRGPKTLREPKTSREPKTPREPQTLHEAQTPRDPKTSKKPKIGAGSVEDGRPDAGPKSSAGGKTGVGRSSAGGKPYAKKSGGKPASAGKPGGTRSAPGRSPGRK